MLLTAVSEPVGNDSVFQFHGYMITQFNLLISFTVEVLRLKFYVLKELHWLPVDGRIEYKILLYAYKALNGFAPEYLCNMVQLYAPDRVL